MRSRILYEQERSFLLGRTEEGAAEAASSSPNANLATIRDPLSGVLVSSELRRISSPYSAGYDASLLDAQLNSGGFWSSVHGQTLLSNSNVAGWWTADNIDGAENSFLSGVFHERECASSAGREVDAHSAEALDLNRGLLCGVLATRWKDLSGRGNDLVTPRSGGSDGVLGDTIRLSGTGT